MNKQFKYTTKFSDLSLASEDINDSRLNISEASLDSLKSMIPGDVDLEKNLDLLGVAFNAAVVNKFNKNGDGISSSSAVDILDQFKHKPTNIEHKKEKVVGHIVSALFSRFETNEIMDTEEALATEGSFNISLAALIYKSVNSEFANLVEESMDPESPLYNKVSASWEIGFNDYVLAVGNDDLSGSVIIDDEEKIEELKNNLKAYGGTGLLEDGSTINRLIIGEIFPLGIGFTSNPAAEVKGITRSSSKNEEPVTEQDEKSYNGDKDYDYGSDNEVENKKNKKNISQMNESDVINKKRTTMENNEILNNLVSALEDKVSNKKFSEEAVATVSKIINDAILEKNTSFLQEKDKLETEKAELAKAAEDNAAEVAQLRSELDSAVSKVNDLEQTQRQQEAVATFDSRMSAVEEIYSLDEASRKVVALELKDLALEDEAFATFQEKLEVVLKHQNKQFITQQEEEFNTKLAEAVEKRISELKNVDSSEDQVLEEALDNVEAETEVIANNNADSSKEEESLSERFKKAFSEDNLTINY